MSVFGFASIAAGVALVVRGWRYVDARSTERRMLAQGGGQGGEFGSRLGGQRDGLLALAALRGPGLTPSEWRDIEAAATSDPAFADRLCAGLLAVPAANRAVFLGAAPAGLKQFLVGSLRARKSPARSPAAFAFVAAWLACLAAGVVGGAVEAPQASLSTTDWLLLLAGAGALPAIMLAVAQATHRVRGRRLARLP
jgi:hypothetical protein